MFIEGGWAIAGALDQQEVEADTDIALWPALPNGLGEANEVTWASGWGWAANNQLSGAKKEAAISLLKALSDEAYGKARIERGLGTPQKVSGYDASKLPRLFVLEDKYAQNWKAVPILTLGFPAAVTDVLSIGLQEITVGITDPATVAKKVQAEYIKQ
jgi:raffinose/stachyose/melibiose transport system substrate-binding protein